MTDTAIAELAPETGVRAACDILGAAQAGYYRRHRQSPPPQRPEPIPHRDRHQPRALSDADVVRQQLPVGSFKGDPRRLVEGYFDAFLYVANWGTRELTVRMPARLVDPEILQRYCSGDAVSAWHTGDHVIVAAVSEDEEGDFEWGGEGVLASILPVRAEVLAGDLPPWGTFWMFPVGNLGWEMATNGIGSKQVLGGRELFSEYDAVGGDVELSKVLLMGAGSCLEYGDRSLEL